MPPCIRRNGAPSRLRTQQLRRRVGAWQELQNHAPIDYLAPGPGKRRRGRPASPCFDIGAYCNEVLQVRVSLLAIMLRALSDICTLTESKSPDLEPSDRYGFLRCSLLRPADWATAWCRQQAHNSPCIATIGPPAALGTGATAAAGTTFPAGGGSGGGTSRSAGGLRQQRQRPHRHRVRRGGHRQRHGRPVDRCAAGVQGRQSGGA
jgi:hypothetical protein